MILSLGGVCIRADSVDFAEVIVYRSINRGQEEVDLVMSRMCCSSSINCLLVEGSLTWDFHGEINDPVEGHIIRAVKDKVQVLCSMHIRFDFLEGVLIDLIEKGSYTMAIRWRKRGVECMEGSSHLGILEKAKGSTSNKASLGEFLLQAL